MIPRLRGVRARRGGTEAQARREVEAAGFRFVSYSDVLPAHARVREAAQRCDEQAVRRGWACSSTTAFHMRASFLSLLFLVSLAGCASTATTEAPRPAQAEPGPYAGLSAEIRTALEAGFYEPAALANPNWQRFFERLDTGLAAARTDTAAYLAFRTARPEAGISHFEFYKASAIRPSTNAAAPVSYEVRPDGVAVLRIRTFGMSTAAQPIVAAFGAMAAAPPRALIVDLRGNGGGDLSSMLVAGHLIAQPTPAGLFVARTFWATHDAVPPPSEWNTLPLLTSLDEDAFFEALSTEGALVGVVPPMGPRYAGPVYLLTDGGTGSACEPLAYLLKSTGRATLVGETTAGAMLSATTTELSNGWTLRFPAADYYVPDGTRLDGVGVAPDVAVPSAQAMDEALRMAMAG